MDSLEKGKRLARALMRENGHTPGRFVESGERALSNTCSRCYAALTVDASSGVCISGVAASQPCGKRAVPATGT